MKERKVKDVEIKDASTSHNQAEGPHQVYVSSKENQVGAGSRRRTCLLVCFVLLTLFLGVSMFVRGVEEAGAVGTIFIENIKPRFFVKDPLEKYDCLVSAACLCKKSKKLKAALLLLDAAEKETKTFGSSNVYVAYLLSLKGDCIYQLGDRKLGRSLVKRSLRMWYDTRGRRTAMVASTWELLANMYTNNDLQIRQKCLLNAIWSSEHSQGPFSREAIMDKYALLNHPNLLFSYSSLQYDDVRCEMGQLFAERIKRYDDIRKLQDQLTEVSNGIPIAAKISPVVPREFIGPVIEFNRKYRSDDRKTYTVHNSALSYLEDDAAALVYNLSLRLRLLNRQATLLHLMNKHSEAKPYERKADELLIQLVELDPDKATRAKFKEYVERYRGPDGWLPNDDD